jgi:hypothetical protein
MHNGRRFRRKTGFGKIYTVCHSIMFLNGLINKSINGNTIVSIKLFSSCMPTGHSYFTSENFVIFYAKNADRNITWFEILTALSGILFYFSHLFILWRSTLWDFNNPF